MLYDPKWKPVAKKTAKPKKKVREIKAKGLTQSEIKYMKKVLAYLKEGKITSKHFDSPMMFNMATVVARNWDYSKPDAHCGTVGCIGGWMMLLQRMDRGMPISQARRVGRERLMERKVLRPLFYPDTDIMVQATPEDGIRAIENFLYRGYQKRPWNFMKR